MIVKDRNLSERIDARLVNVRAGLDNQYVTKEALAKVAPFNDVTWKNLTKYTVGQTGFSYFGIRDASLFYYGLEGPKLPIFKDDLKLAEQLFPRKTQEDYSFKLTPEFFDRLFMATKGPFSVAAVGFRIYEAARSVYEYFLDGDEPVEMTLEEESRYHRPEDFISKDVLDMARDEIFEGQEYMDYIIARTMLHGILSVNHKSNEHIRQVFEGKHAPLYLSNQEVSSTDGYWQVEYGSNYDECTKCRDELLDFIRTDEKAGSGIYDPIDFYRLLRAKHGQQIKIKSFRKKKGRYVMEIGIHNGVDSLRKQTKTEMIIKSEFTEAGVAVSVFRSRNVGYDEILGKYDDMTSAVYLNGRLQMYRTINHPYIMRRFYKERYDEERVAEIIDMTKSRQADHFEEMGLEIDVFAGGSWYEKGTRSIGAIRRPTRRLYKRRGIDHYRLFHLYFTPILRGFGKPKASPGAIEAQWAVIDRRLAALKRALGAGLYDRTMRQNDSYTNTMLYPSERDDYRKMIFRIEWALSLLELWEYEKRKIDSEMLGELIGIINNSNEPPAYRKNSASSEIGGHNTFYITKPERRKIDIPLPTKVEEAIDFMKKLYEYKKSGGSVSIDYGKMKCVIDFVESGSHQYPLPASVGDLMKSFMDMYNGRHDEQHPIEVAAKVYQRIIEIRPYEDGNQRLAYVLAAHILRKSGYPIPANPIGTVDEIAVLGMPTADLVYEFGKRITDRLEGISTEAEKVSLGAADEIGRYNRKLYEDVDGIRPDALEPWNQQNLKELVHMLREVIRLYRRSSDTEGTGVLVERLIQLKDVLDSTRLFISRKEIRNLHRRSETKYYEIGEKLSNAIDIVYRLTRDLDDREFKVEWNKLKKIMKDVETARNKIELIGSIRKTLSGDVNRLRYATEYQRSRLIGLLENAEKRDKAVYRFMLRLIDKLNLFGHFENEVGDNGNGNHGIHPLMIEEYLEDVDRKLGKEVFSLFRRVKKIDERWNAIKQSRRMTGDQYRKIKRDIIMFKAAAKMMTVGSINVPLLANLVEKYERMGELVRMIHKKGFTQEVEEGIKKI